MLARTSAYEGRRATEREWTMDFISSEFWAMLGAVGTFFGGLAAILTVLAREGWLRWLAVGFRFLFASVGVLLLMGLATLHFTLALDMLLRMLAIEPSRAARYVVVGVCFVLAGLLTNALLSAGQRGRQSASNSIALWAFLLTAAYYGVGIWVLNWSLGHLLGLWVATILAPPIVFAGGALTAYATSHPRQSGPAM